MSTPATAAPVWASVYRSLTGPASIGLAGWTGTLLPSAVLVVVQEATTPFPSFLLVLASALLQHTADGVLDALALAVQRVFPRLDRLLIRLVLWTAIGLGRGLIGGAWAASFADVSPDFGYRIAFWLLVTWAWMPTIGYTIAQLDTRRALLGRREAESRGLAEAGMRDDERQNDLRSRLLDAVRNGIAPAVEEVRVRLLRLGSDLDASATRSIGARISAILDESVRIVEATGRPGARTPADPRPRAPLWAAIAFTERRPWWEAGVMAVGMATLLLPESLRIAGAIGAIPVAAGIAASVAVVLLTALIERRLTFRTFGAQATAFVVRALAAGGAGALTIVALGDLRRVDVVLAITLLPVVATLAAAVVPTVVGIHRANDAVRTQIDDLRAARERLDESAEADEQRVRAHVTQLLHGPIQGRLSACAMALSFHAAAETPPDASRTDYIVTSVLEHLDAVARDLEALAGRSDTAPSAPRQGGGAAEARG